MKIRSVVSIGFLCSLFLACGSDDILNPGIETSANAQLFASSKAGQVKKFDINTGEKTTFNISSSVTDAVYYSPGEDAIIALSRSSAQLQGYGGLSDLQPGSSHGLSVSFAGSSDLTDPLDLAVSGEYYIVSDNSPSIDETNPSHGRLVVYQKSSEGFKLRNVLRLSFKIAGIVFNGEDLYAANTDGNQIAIFRNFINSHTTNKDLNPEKQISLAGMSQIQGLDFQEGVLVVSDVSNLTSNIDGKIHIVTEFNTKFNATANGGVIALEDQLVIAGDKTLLGNPVDVFYDAGYNVIFVAEQLNGGGRILGFTNARSTSGNVVPKLNYKFSQASGLDFFKE